MKKNGFPLKMIVLLTLFCLYGTLKMSSAIVELANNTEGLQKSHGIKLAGKEHFRLPVISCFKSSAKTK